MKHFLIVITILSLTACKSWDLSMVSVSESPNQNKLLSLYKNYGDFDNISRTVPDEESKLFTQELETNLMDPYGDKYGYISVITRVADSKNGFALWYSNIILLGIPSLVGAPFGLMKYKLEVEMRIHDKNLRLLGKYSAIGESKTVPVAFYYGYRESQARDKAYSEAFNAALDSLRPKIQTDAERINQILLNTGKLEIVPND